MKWKALAPWKKSYDQPRQHVKKQRHYFANKCPFSQSYGFSSGHVYMWELDHKEIWLKRIDVFELWCWRRLLRVPWTARRSNQSILKEINPEYSFRTDTETETPILWPPDVKNWPIWKDPDDGKIWMWEEKGMSDDDTVGWHHQLNGHEFEYILGVGDGHGGLACFSPWGCKELDRTEWLNWADWLYINNVSCSTTCSPS